MDNTVAKQYKEEKAMAHGKIAWVAIQFLGWPLTALSFLENFEQPYKTVITILTILFLTTVVIRAVVRLFDAYESYRDKKISNDERKYQIEQKHRRDSKA